LTVKQDDAVTAIDTPLKMDLISVTEWTDRGHTHRREHWAIMGGEIDPAWRKSMRGEHREPSSRFTLYIVDDVIDRRLASYGGVVWPTAWTDLFQSNRQPGSRAFVEITDEGLRFRDAALRVDNEALKP
jgi:hypothetical protein